MMRTGEIKRRTNETDVALKLEVDGQGRFAGQTGVGFLDHMLALFAGHGLFDLTVTGAGADFDEARRRAYGGMEQIHFTGMHFRRDIGS